MHPVSSEHPSRTCSGAVLRNYARAFGDEAEDLDMDFAQLSRPELVSALLSRCLFPAKSVSSANEDVWSWTVGQRLQGLLAVASVSAVSRLTTVQRCDRCAESMEIPIDVNDFARTEPLTDFEWSPQAEHRLSVSLPTGHDQRRWLGAGETTGRAMARELVSGLDGEPPAPDWEMPDDWIDGVAEQLDRHDPLTALELQSRCPACAADMTIELDLEALLLQQLHARQRETLRVIHLLASRYHWTEAEILRLPSWRRRHYLAPLDVRGST
jgi:hypothetical protein